MQFQKLDGAKGLMPINMGFWGAYRDFVINGGPYADYPGKPVFGVCVRSEGIVKEFDIRVPIRDFNIPDDDDEVELALKMTLIAAVGGMPIFVGCMGGIGRTGLFMALIAKTCGVRDPVAYVRKHYFSHAVETSDQKEYVKGFDVTRLQRWLFWYSWKQLFLDW